MGENQVKGTSFFGGGGAVVDKQRKGIQKSEETRSLKLVVWEVEVSQENKWDVKTET